MHPWPGALLTVGTTGYMRVVFALIEFTVNKGGKQGTTNTELYIGGTAVG